MLIWPEKKQDIPAIRRLNEIAFGQKGEANLVDALRERGAITLSLVALEDERIVGHILFSPVTIEQEGAAIKAVGLGPMAILPEHQNTGIGSRLVRYGIDELKKQYVLCARARGLHPALVVLRYPVRVAINPLVSGVGLILPEIISGSMIISIVLNLPTLGPKVLTALESQDTYLAASCIFVQCILAVVGILVSDILLSLVDPRIKFGAR